MSDDETIAILVVSYRTPALTIAAVASALAVDSVSEVIVVDNASGDDTLERLGSVGDDRLRVIPNDQNLGFAAAANQAAAQATSARLVFMNSDAELESTSLAPLMRELDRSSGRVIAGPRVVYPSGLVQRSAGLLPRPSDLAIRALSLHRVALAVARVPMIGRLLDQSSIGTEYATSVTATKPVATSMISGSCLAVGREAFLELGGFDERYFMYFEDADLCRRAAAAGLPIRFIPEAQVVHIGGASSKGSYQFGPLHGPSMVVYLRRWYGARGATLALGLLLARAMGMTLAVRPGAQRARTALTEGVRAYRLGRTRSPIPANVPSP